MTVSEHIETSFDELESYISDIERDIDGYLNEYLTSFSVDGDELRNTYSNFEKASASDKIFDEIYDSLMVAFLLFLAGKIHTGIDLLTSEFSMRGLKITGDEHKLADKIIGMKDGKIVKGGYLWNLGKMSVVRQRFNQYVVRSVSGAQKLNLFLRNARPFFRSTDKKTSLFADYYRRYAFDSVNQTINAVSLRLADENGLDRFVYEGGLMKDSRQFCRDHVGGTFTRADAAEFDQMQWRGKIPGVPFLIAVGGFNCIHHIKWIKD